MEVFERAAVHFGVPLDRQVAHDLIIETAIGLQQERRSQERVRQKV